jgi:outer membrane protein assembly factor BamA
VFSIPDFELREGTAYPFAIDILFDYDKWLRDNFYGIGNRSSASDIERYTRIPMSMEIDFSRGFSSTFVGQLKMRTMSIENNNFETNSRLAVLPPSLNSGTVKFTSVGLAVRYDSRNSFINASSGLVLQGESELSPEWELGNTHFTRLTGWIQYYQTLFSSNAVLAWRVGLQQVMGNDIPVQVMSSLGGTGTLRGYPQDRFLDKADILINAEIRFPVWWRFGGVLGLDAGKVWPSLGDMDLQRWAYNPVAGLRFYMDNFVVRADIGFGSEGTGFYFNFGQLF